MHTYLVLYFVGQIIFTLGPYPDGANAVCWSSAHELQAKAREHWAEFRRADDVITSKPTDLVAKCIDAATRPVINDKSVPLSD